ncbi:MAG: cobalamin biosynthesis protein CobD [Hyphomicrobiaceae bacterium]
MNMAAILLLAMIIEVAVGWPEWLHRRIGHPVTWIGRFISFLDRRYNRADTPDRLRRFYGMVAAICAIGLVGFAGWIMAHLLPNGLWGVLIGGVIAWPLLATRSMYEHVAAVARPLASDDIGKAREAVAMIVGREPDRLEPAAISRAALESLAENTSDGIVAPVFWGLLLGLPGIAGYKAVNTLDSMIGHRTPRHEAFGWAAARIDDIANFLPARLTGGMFCIISSRFRAAFACMLRDGRQHRSPNAGWPEAALAGALNVRLSGPRAYAAGVSDEPWLNFAARDAEAMDLERGLALFVRTMLLLAGMLALLAMI